MSGRKDVRTGELSWNPKDAPASLDGLYDFVKGRAERVVDWYLKSRRDKKHWAIRLRGLAIILATAAAIIPILALIITNKEGKAIINPAYASVGLAAVGMLVAMDRLLGLSSSWIRYVSTELRVQKRLNEFLIEWQCEKAKWIKGEPAKNQTAVMFRLAKQFIKDVDELIIEETAAWEAEFQSALKQIKELAKMRGRMQKT